jgi:uncharacterized membrane protein YheB (UPF0754 family)
VSRSRNVVQIGGACLAIALAAGAAAQGTTSSTTTTTTTPSSPAKKELVQKILQQQQAEIENVARSIVERPAAQMMQEAGLAMQRQVPPDKREAMGKAIEAEVKKYVDESYPLVRERALRLAPSILGAALEERFSEDELKQLLGWLESPVNRKFQQLGTVRNAFVQKVLSESIAAVDPKVGALDARIRAILGVPPATQGPAASGSPPRPAPPAARASGR